MEGYTRNPRSHYRPAPQPPSTAAGNGYYNKGFGNGAVVSGGNGFTAYDDVFGGPPKFGATPFAPRAEDYSEIFGSFRSSRSSSIPMLDLPPVDDSAAAFEVVGCSGMEYSDIFGGFDFDDFAASYDELFRRSDGSEESSDDAWTPVGTESPSGESPYASSGRNKYFMDGDFHETLEDKVFDFSYNNVNLGTTENLEHFYEPQPSSFPVYAYEVEGSDMKRESKERYSSAVADDIILCEDSSGNISVQAPWKTELPHLPTVSELPPTIVDRKKDPASSTSDYEQSKTSTIETIFGGGSFDFIDVELSAGSSSIASAAAIKEAMERAKVKINSAQELRKRKKDSAKDTHFMNSDLNSEGKVTMLFDEATLRADEPHLKDKRESSGVKTSGDSVQFSSNASEVMPDSLRFQDAVNKAAEPAQRNFTKNQRLSLDPVLTEGDSEWKVTTECFELVNNGNSNAEINQLDSIEKPVQKLEQEVVENDVNMKEYEGSESADEARNPRDNRRRLRGKKTASRNVFHEKMVKLAQDVHETVVVSGHVEPTRSGKKGDEATQNPKIHHVRRFDRFADQVYYDRNQNEDFYLAGSELSSEEDFVHVDIDEKGKKACSFNENRETEVAAKKQTQKWVEEVAKREANGRGLIDAHQEEEKELCVRKGAVNEQKESDVKLKKAHKESNGREDIVCEIGAHKTDECEGNADMSDCYKKKLKESVEVQNLEKHDLDTVNAAKKDEVDAHEEMEEEPLQTNEFENSQMDECWAINEELQMKSEVDLLSELKTADQDSNQDRNVTADQDSNQDRNVHIESENSISAGPSTPGEVVPKKAHENQELRFSSLSSSPDFTSTSEERLGNHVHKDIPVNKEKSDSSSADLNGEADTKDFCKSTKQTQMTEANQPLMTERKEANQRVGKETKAVNGDAAAEDREIANKLKRKEESDKERLRELQLEKERALEAQRVRKLEEEREKEREKLRLRRLEELREEEREKDLEKERLRKLEEEWEREREREKDRMGVELKMSADRAALERATIETRQRAMAEARERLEKACAEAREKSVGKTFKDSSQLRAERAAVERATAEARERAMEKAMADRATYGTRERVERSVSEKFTTSFRNVELRNCSSSSDLWNSDKSDGVEGESSQRCRARLERHRRTVDRVAKALAEKNMRDLIAQREQAERNRFAETLDADIKRWSNGKEGNLRALLSTLQYILGAESGWQSIPLTEVITSAAVKKAYRKATLCVHPDKLQQRGATIQQKYICEKVFDLLKDAWNRFNSEER